MGQIFFLQHIKNKIIFSFVKFVATKNGLTKFFFSSLSFVAVFGSGIRAPGSGMGKNQDPGSGMFIMDHDFFPSRISDPGSNNKKKEG